MKQELIAFDAVVEHDGDVAPLAQARVLSLEPEIFLIDDKDLVDRSHPVVESDQRPARNLQRRRGPIGHGGSHAIKQVALCFSDQDKGDGQSGKKRDGELRSATIPRNLPAAVRHNSSNPAARPMLSKRRRQNVTHTFGILEDASRAERDT